MVLTETPDYSDRILIYNCNFSGQDHPQGEGGQLGNFASGPSLKGALGGPIKGPLNTCLKHRFTLIEQSGSRYSNRAVTAFFRGAV